MSRTLVTGGGGFIGSHVVTKLLARGDRVRVLHLPDDPLQNLRDLDVERVPGDVTDPASVRRAVKDCDLVFHLAALYALWLPRPERFHEINVGGTRNVLQAASDAGVRRVVYTSSIAVFGGQGRHSDATETSPFQLGRTGDAYSISKYEAHRVAREFAANGLDVVIVAPNGPIGPGDVGPTPTGRLLLSALNEPALIVVDSAVNLADVRDIAAGHLLAAEHGRRGESYLLGTENVTFTDLARRALRAAGIERRIVKLPYPVAKAGAFALLKASEHLLRRPPLVTPQSVAIAELGLRADCSKSYRDLGVPRSPLDPAIRDALIWFARNGYVKSRRVTAHLANTILPGRPGDG